MLIKFLPSKRIVAWWHTIFFLLMYSHYMKKSDKFLEQNFAYEQTSKFLSDFLPDSHDILRLKILQNVKFNKFRT